MELTADFETGLIEQVRQDPLFANALLDEVGELILAKENFPAQGMLRVLVNATVGLDTLAEALSMTGPSLRKLLSQDTDIDTASLQAITQALKLALGVAAS
ncbi:hypothetical protein SAMN05216319_2843 [Duganella sp. CF402]|uniref:hypothetical protein n=1 Tax=unclassified Duganella TaxID=2636909 RepID=UPI0008B8D9FE|nr:MULTISPECIES: hypothetical protein [unclassified Duganella]RZT08741.1 hypothetical protein EV582_0777 [Duganella sp. BK701]SEL83526.1 hypothetical protein SAMN05216319_2843 [Duganella sp. CF402]